MADDSPELLKTSLTSADVDELTVRTPCAAARPGRPRALGVHRSVLTPSRTRLSQRA